MTIVIQGEMNNWYCSDGREQRGPFQEAQLLDLIARRQVAGGFISLQGSGRWQTLESHPPFAEALGRARSPAQPTPPVAAGVPKKQLSKNTKVAIAAAVGVTLLSIVTTLVWAFAEPPELEGRVELLGCKMADDNPDVAVLRFRVPTRGFERLHVWGKVSRDMTLKPVGADRGPDSDGVLEARVEVPDWAVAGGESEEIPFVVEGYTTGRKSRYREAKLKIRVEKPRRLKLQVKDATAKIDCGRSCGGELSKDGKLPIQLPPGVVLIIDGHRQTTSGEASFDILRRAGTTGFQKDQGMKIPVEMVAGGGKTDKGSLDLSAAHVQALFSQRMTSNAEKGTSLGAGDTPSPRPRALVFNGTVLGAWGGYQEIDLVATIREVEENVGSCGTYRNNRTGAVTTISRTTRNHVYRVFDRRTGKLTQTRTIRPAPPSCPDKLEGRYGGVYSEAKESDGIQYLRTLVR